MTGEVENNCLGSKNSVTTDTVITAESGLM